MTAGGERAQAAGLTNPNPETAVTFSRPGGLPPHARALPRVSGIAVVPASP